MGSCKTRPQTKRCKAIFANMHAEGIYNKKWANISPRRRKGLRDSTGGTGIDVVDYSGDNGNTSVLTKTRNYYTNKFIL